MSTQHDAGDQPVRHYDLLVLGTGSGNTVVDDRFDDWSVGIVERTEFGGTCLNRGCIPSKMLVVTADHACDAAQGRRFGVHTRFDGVDWPAVRDRVFGRIDPQAQGGREYREGLANVEVHAGTAHFTGERRLVVETEQGEVHVSADQVVLAVGGRPVVPDIEGLEEASAAGLVHTSDTIMRIDALPRRLGVVGGGYVGSEFANIFASLGTEVVQVDGQDLLLSTQDADVARRFTEISGERWDLRLGAELERVELTGDGLRLHLGEQGTADVDLLLLAVGRRPNSDLLSLDGTGIEVDDAGRVVVDEYQRTTAQGVWALGDISTHHPLKHVANHEARIVQHNLLHPDDLKAADHRFVPQAVFSVPQVAAVGLTEAQAREQGLDVAVFTQRYADVAHGWALEEDDSGHLVKVLADRATGRLVGAHLLGPQASVLVQPLIQAMSFDQPVRGLARGQYWIHPALIEVVENALLGLEAELDA